MRIENTSRFPDNEVRALIEFATKGVNMTGVYVKVKNARTGSIGGMTYFGVPYISPIRKLKTVDRLMTLRVGPDSAFPATNFLESKGHPYGGKSSPLIRYEDWREGLVALAAHEARHVYQANNLKRMSEVDAEKFADRRLDLYRATRKALA